MMTNRVLILRNRLRPIDHRRPRNRNRIIRLSLLRNNITIGIQKVNVATRRHSQMNIRLLRIIMFSKDVPTLRGTSTVRRMLNKVLPRVNTLLIMPNVSRSIMTPLTRTRRHPNPKWLLRVANVANPHRHNTSGVDNRSAVSRHNIDRK